MSRRRTRRGAAALALLALVAGPGCWEQVDDGKWFPQMKRQPAVQAWEINTLVADHPQGLSPPEGTLPLGWANEPDLESMDLATQDAVPNPVPTSLDSLKNGEVLFAQNCAACHGPEGHGNGTVAGPPYGNGPLGLVLPIGGPASIARALTDGHIFTTISLGRGRMPNYARIPAEGRWDIVNYLRELNGQNGQGSAQ